MLMFVVCDLCFVVWLVLRVVCCYALFVGCLLFRYLLLLLDGVRWVLFVDCCSLLFVVVRCLLLIVVSCLLIDVCCLLVIVCCALGVVGCSLY